jgi:hypothetical protein
MNADERGYKSAKAFVSDLRSSAFITVYQRPTMSLAFSAACGILRRSGEADCQSAAA